MREVVILGSTGSIGVNALNIAAAYPEKFRVAGLAAGGNLALLARQIETFRPRMVSVADKEKARQLRAMISRRVKVAGGVAGAIEVASLDKVDVVVSAMVGAAGLAPTLAAVSAGRLVALANKETLVTAGELVMREARARKAKIIPVDSEHSAIFQALRGEKRSCVRRLILTASGGPFLNVPREKLAHVTVEEALRHPNWRMGPKITIDSATMMNKGLEVIEARWLFNIPPARIEVLGHPQSVIHSMVEFCDSSVIAQLGLPDMRAPIAFAMNYPDRLDGAAPSLDLARVGALTFVEPDREKFPALRLAYEALARGGAATAALNAANEVAVTAYLGGNIGFTDIARIVEHVVDKCPGGKVSSLADALTVDRWARGAARELTGAAG